MKVVWNEKLMENLSGINNGNRIIKANMCVES